MLPYSTSIAFKEWAVTVRALAQGKQVLLMRKGGIREEGREFKVQHHEFLLYPTYEHQRADLLQESYRLEYKPALEHLPNPSKIAFTHWARVEETLELWDEATLPLLQPFHIWTQDYAEKRLHWKPRKPLILMLLRVYSLGIPQSVDFKPHYDGCKSWVALDSQVSMGDPSPVLTDAQFHNGVLKVKDVLSLSSVKA
ncbi:MAG: DUF1802 family protein [SAR202 cluster bacterium]|nr:DUF1802 family protein [SAR202 cluster bacterium]